MCLAGEVQALVEEAVDRRPDNHDPEWVTVAEAARRLAMSASWFKEWASEEGIQVVRRGRKPGVNWTSVETAIVRSRITRVGHSLLRQTDPELPIHGVSLLEDARSLLGSDGQVARHLGVTAGTVSRWRVDGVPDSRIRQLAELLGCPESRLPVRGHTAGPRTPRRR